MTQPDANEASGRAGTPEEFTAALERAYQEAGEQIGYWARRYIQKVRRVGGLATATEMLTPRTSAQRAGLDRLLGANRPDLTLEYIALSARFRALFTQQQLAEAQTRLSAFIQEAERKSREYAHEYPDDLDPRVSYPAGVRRTVRVNAFERDRRARDACLAHHGTQCAVCAFDFGVAFGELGAGFIHVHHLTPVSRLTDPSYALDPTRDLIPVCPNCHAMMHLRADTPRTVAELRALRAARHTG